MCTSISTILLRTSSSLPKDLSVCPPFKKFILRESHYTLYPPCRPIPRNLPLRPLPGPLLRFITLELWQSTLALLTIQSLALSSSPYGLRRLEFRSRALLIYPDLALDHLRADRCRQANRRLRICEKLQSQQGQLRSSYRSP